MDQTILKNIISSADEVYPDNDILAQVCVSQAILESGFQRQQGGSDLAVKYFNLFGIKGEGTHNPPSISYNTKEYTKDGWITIKQDFAWNNTWEDSFKQHKAFLEKPRYHAVLEAGDVVQAFRELKLAGYATDNRYPELLTDIWLEYVKPYY